MNVLRIQRAVRKTTNAVRSSALSPPHHHRVLALILQTEKSRKVVLYATSEEIEIFEQYGKRPRVFDKKSEVADVAVPLFAFHII